MIVGLVLFQLALEQFKAVAERDGEAIVSQRLYTVVYAGSGKICRIAHAEHDVFILIRSAGNYSRIQLRHVVFHEFVVFDVHPCLYAGMNAEAVQEVGVEEDGHRQIVESDVPAVRLEPLLRIVQPARYAKVRSI